MDDEELRRLRVQHIMDQNQASWDEARRLVQTQFDFPYYGAGDSTDKLTDTQAAHLLNMYRDAPTEEWVLEEMWPELTLKAHLDGQEHALYPAMPMLMNWIDEDSVVVKTTLTMQLQMFVAGWRAAIQRERTRIGDRDLTTACVQNMLGIATFMIDKMSHELDYEALVSYQRVKGSCEVFLRMLEAIPAEWFTNDEEQINQEDDGGTQADS